MELFNLFQEALSQIQESYIQEGKGKEFEMWFSFEYHDSTENTIKIIVPSNFSKTNLFLAAILLF